MLLVPPAAWWSAPLLASLQDANRFPGCLGPLACRRRRLIRKLGRNVLIGYTQTVIRRGSRHSACPMS